MEGGIERDTPLVPPALVSPLPQLPLMPMRQDALSSLHDGRTADGYMGGPAAPRLVSGAPFRATIHKVSQSS